MTKAAKPIEICGHAVAPGSQQRIDIPLGRLVTQQMLDLPLIERLRAQGIGIHHPRFGKLLKERMDELGIECEVHTGIPRGDDWTKLTVDFVKKHLGVK